jgi:hypothetical protein
MNYRTGSGAVLGSVPLALAHPSVLAPVLVSRFAVLRFAVLEPVFQSSSAGGSGAVLGVRFQVAVPIRGSRGAVLGAVLGAVPSRGSRGAVPSRGSKSRFY